MSFEQIANFKIANVSINDIFSAILLLVLCLLVMKLFMRLVDRLLLRLKVAVTLHNFIRSAAKFVLLFITTLIVADSLGIPVTSLLAILSVAGLAVSLAIQDSLSKLASGLTILAVKPFVVGDYITVGDISGTVQEIGLIYTRLATPDNKSIYLPNNDVANARVVNFSAQETRRVDLSVCASYDDDTSTVKQALRQAMNTVGRGLSDPAPFVGITAYQDSSIQYTIRVWVKTADYWDVYLALLEEVRTSFGENGVEMTYPHLNVHLTGQPKE